MKTKWHPNHLWSKDVELQLRLCVCVNSCLVKHSLLSYLCVTLSVCLSSWMGSRNPQSRKHFPSFILRTCRCQLICVYVFMPVSVFAFVRFLFFFVCVRFTHSSTTCPQQSLTSGGHSSAQPLWLYFTDHGNGCCVGCCGVCVCVRAQEKWPQLWRKCFRSLCAAS